jgi:uncharacterized protein YutE (UPF0331/DUF86 family)
MLVKDPFKAHGSLKSHGFKKTKNAPTLKGLSHLRNLLTGYYVDREDIVQLLSVCHS